MRTTHTLQLIIAIFADHRPIHNLQSALFFNEQNHYVIQVHIQYQQVKSLELWQLTKAPIAPYTSKTLHKF